MKKTCLLIALFLLGGLSLMAQQDNREKQHCDNKCAKSCKTNPHDFTATIGYGFMFGDSHDKDVFVNYRRDDHARHMRHGINYEFDYDYNFHKNFAFGAVFSMYNTFDSYYPTTTAVETASDDKYLFYVGPSFLAHLDQIADKWTFYARATVGLMNFRNAVRAPLIVDADGTTDPSGTFKRMAFGYGLELGADYSLGKYVSLIGQVTYKGASIEKVKNGDEKFELSDNENLSHLTVSVGAKIKL